MSDVILSFNEEEIKEQKHYGLVVISNLSGYICIFIFIIVLIKDCQEKENEKKYGFNLSSLSIIFCCRRKQKLEY